MRPRPPGAADKMLNQPASVAEPFDELDSLSSAALDKWWIRRLRKVFTLAAERLPFYRDRFRAAGFDPARFRTLDDLRAVPISNKSDLLAIQRKTREPQPRHRVRGGRAAGDGYAEPELGHLRHDFHHPHQDVDEDAGALVVPRSLVGGSACGLAAADVRSRMAQLRRDPAVHRDAFRDAMRGGVRNLFAPLCRSGG